MSDETKRFRATQDSVTVRELTDVPAIIRTWPAAPLIADQHRRMVGLLRRWQKRDPSDIYLTEDTTAALAEIDGATPVKP